MISPWLAIALVCAVAILIWGWKAYDDAHRTDAADSADTRVQTTLDGEAAHTMGAAASGPGTASAGSESAGSGSAGKKKTGKSTASAQSPYEKVRVPKDVPQKMLCYHGFTVSFNPEAHQPNYVVWELTGAEARSQECSRTNNFAPDLNVDSCATLADYANSGYDRGHMAPAGDMKWSIDAMNDCFLLTNMSPQSNKLNAGAWNTLEDKCRQWAVRDSAIVIVCGPVLTDKITRYIGDSNVPVPERYFKVILAPYANPPRGIGFIMPNTKVAGGLQASAVSIDEVEEATGFDFFHALPDKTEKAVESESNYAKWTQK